jgi:hypothetical protein
MNGMKQHESLRRITMTIRGEPTPDPERDWLEAGLVGLKAEMARVQAPRGLEGDLRARFRAGRLARPALPAWRVLLQQFVVPAVAIGVVLALFVPFFSEGLLAPDLSGEAELSPPTVTPFFALGDSRKVLDPRLGVIVATELPRQTLLDFGLPIDPGQVSQPVKADVLVGAGGEILAVRFASDASNAGDAGDAGEGK